MKLPPEAGSLSSQWRREGDSCGQGRREGEWALFAVPQGTGRKGKMRQKARGQPLSCLGDLNHPAWPLYRKPIEPCPGPLSPSR